MMSFKKEKIHSILNEYSKLVEPVVKELLSSYVDKEHQEIVRYQILTGGKRLRPVLVIITCQLLGGKIKDAILPAAGLEILHNYSLIVDDIIDHSSLRRGKPTTWFKFGRSMAECAGIDYAAAAFQAANFSKEPIKISELFAKTMKAVVDGEILDILFEQQGREEEPYVVENRYNNITERDYFQMVNKKTASLFQTCCEVGGICAGAKEKELEALRNYGFNLGIGFQISDDILDIFGKEEKFGKKIGQDIKERKLGNIVIFYTLKELSQSGRNELFAILRKNKIKDNDIKKGIKIIKGTKAREKVLNLGKKYIQKAKENLKFLPQNQWHNILEEIANFVIKRER